MHKIDDRIATEDTVKDNRQIDRSIYHPDYPHPVPTQHPAVNQDKQQVEQRDRIARSDGRKDFF